jgi:hypothetical protein
VLLVDGTPGLVADFGELMIACGCLLRSFFFFFNQHQVLLH